ncbi:MAG: anti-sigma factor [Chloroflexota bacterium]|nr:anti-sigma factor [Chloroflexota bacterium]
MQQEDALGPGCDAVDQLAGAWALHALPADEELAVAQHLAGCDRPHQELRDAMDAVDLLALSLPEEAPSPAVRARIMRSIDAPARPALETSGRAPLPREPRSWLMPGLAALAAAAALVLAVWNLQLLSEVQSQEANLAQLSQAIAAGNAAYRASGSLGSGYLIDAEKPVLVASLPVAPQGRLYEMWLLDAAGTPVAAGIFEANEQGGLTVVQLERRLSGYATFAITVEERRVDVPSGKPVLAASLTG